MELDFTNDEKFRVVLCGASGYDKKYYFGPQFKGLPENIQEELHIMCVLFTEEAGGVFTIGYTPSGEVMMDSCCDEGDLLYDEISAGLMMKEIRRKKVDLFQSLEAYYKIKFLHMNPADVLDNPEDLDPNVEGNADEETYHKDSRPEDVE